MDIPVMRVTQGAKLLYLGMMTAQEMLDNCVTTEWDPNIGWDLERQGYQRQPLADHYKGIAKYLSSSGDPFMPNGALLSSRDSDYGRLAFRSAGGAGVSPFGYLTLPPGRQLFIVDYQHRWRAFRQAIEEDHLDALKDFAIPVTIMPNVDRHEEIKQFYVINSKQRRIDTDLALALLQTMAKGASQEELFLLVGPGKKYRVRATRLTFKLAAGSVGPWAGRIRQPHDIPEADAVLSVKSFADSLQPIVSSRSPVSALADDKVIEALGNYWTAVAGLMREAFENPREFSIQKTPGVFSMHIVAAKTVLKLCQQKNDYSPGSMKRYLSVANRAVPSDANEYMESNFWRSKGPVKAYGGSGGHRSLATLIRNKIETQYPLS